LNNENRVALTPSGVYTLAQAGHTVTVESEAGLGSGFTDDEYANMGASIVSTPKEAWASDMIMKVKEPIPSEYDFLKEDQIILDRKSTRLNSSHVSISYAVFCLKK